MSHSVFQVQGQWNGGLNGKGRLQAKGFESVISAPLELKGLGVGTNPEELLAGAAASCYLITLGAVLGFQGIAHHGIQIRTEVVADAAGPLKISELRHFPVVQVANETTEEVLTKIRAAIEKAEKICIISQAIQSNVKVSVQGTIAKGLS